MPRLPLFIVIADKLNRVKTEMRRLADHLNADRRSLSENDWSRTALIAFAVHGAYTGIEDIMSDIAREVDGNVPGGATSHQALLDQMRVPLDSRPALLHDGLYAQLVELKTFRHFVRHQYGVICEPTRPTPNSGWSMRLWPVSKRPSRVLKPPSNPRPDSRYRIIENRGVGRSARISCGGWR